MEQKQGTISRKYNKVKNVSPAQFANIPLYFLIHLNVFDCVFLGKYQ